MAFDSHKNFAYSTILVPTSPALSGTTLQLQTGDGAKFPAPPFNGVTWPANTQPLADNAEIVRVTNISGDALTIIRNQEGSIARAITIGDQFAADITAKILTDVENTEIADALAISTKASITALNAEISRAQAAEAALTGGSGVIIESNGVPVITRTHLDFRGAPSLVTDDATNNATRIQILKEYLNVTDPRIGVSMTSTADQSGLMNAGAALAQTAQDGGCLYIPPGQINMAASLDLNTGGNGVMVKLIGAGSGDSVQGGPSLLNFTVDLGAGQSAIKTTGLTASEIRDIAVRGIGYSYGGTLAKGSSMCAMDGVAIDGQSLLANVSSTGFHSGALLLNSHQEVRECDLQGNDYGIRCGNSTNQGDVLVIRTLLTNQQFASIGIDPGGTLANARFIQGHMGESPYAIHRYGSGPTARPGFLSGVTFDNVSFEYCGNGLIWDDPGDGVINGITWDYQAMSSILANAYRWAARAVGPAIKVSQVIGLRFRSNDMEPQFFDTTKAFISANGITDITCDILNQALTDVIAGWKPFVCTTTYSQFNNNDVDRISLGVRCRGGSIMEARIADEAIAQWQLLELSGYTHVRKYRGGIIAGVALSAYAQGDVCMFSVISQGPAQIKAINTSASSIPQGNLIKPDLVNPGGIVAATSITDIPVIGRAYGGGAIAAGAAGNVQLQIA